MKHTTLLPLAAACFAATLAPSCIHWNTGTALRESSTINTGVDVLHPVGGKLYRVGKGEGATYYMQAPEVRYTPRHRFVYQNGIIDAKYHIDKGEQIIATDVHPTGRLCWVQVARYSRLFDIRNSEWAFMQEVPGLPAGAKLVRTGETFDHTAMAAQFGTLSTRESGWKGVKTALSYPAEYVVDPVMWVVGNTAVVVGTAAFVPVAVIGMPVSMAMANASEKRLEESWPQRKADREKAVNVKVMRRGASFVYSASCKTGLVAMASGKRPPELSAIELAEVADKSKPYYLIMSSSLSKAECARAVAELRAQGFHVTAMEKDGKTTFLSPEK